ncbi:MAG: porin [Muribaculaceae bacterium]|nr:porin [Muribaculaceae bacterium]
MKHHLLITALLAASSTYASAAEAPDSLYVPQNAIVVTGNPDKAQDLIAVLYNRTDLHHSDPNAPRFLFFDREGKVAFGIGGYVKGTMQYDFDGSIDKGSTFYCYDIPVPNDPAQRSAFDGTANHSTILLQLVGHNSRFGYYQMYIQTNFSGNGATGYGLKLKQAYVSMGNVTAGLTRSTFVDGSAGTPVIDDQGPAGEFFCNNILLRYARTFGQGFRVAASVEVPQVSSTTGATVQKISQRVPDIPVNIQYAWDGGNSHVRLSALLRNMSYRDLVSGKNRFKTGWGAQLSGTCGITSAVRAYFQGAYGRGYGQYVNDLSGHGFDLVYSQTPGRMEAPRMYNYEIGARVDFTPSLFISGAYSQARLLGTGYMSADTYRYGRYITVSGFYEVVRNLQAGIEYIHGNRKDLNGELGRANRIMGMLKFSF